MASSSRWVPGEPPAGQRAALHRLAASMRKVTEAISDMDASEEDLVAAADAFEAFAERFEASRRGHRIWGYAESAPAGDVLAIFDRSPTIGLGNPIAPPLAMRIDGEDVVGTGTYGRQYEGPPGHVHGGQVAAAFDEVLGMAQSRTGRAGMTGTLTIRYRKPTPLYTELVFRGRVDRVEGRKLFTSGTVHAGETLCAEAEAIFITVDFEKALGR